MAEPTSTTPTQLARFSAEVQNAYARYQATGDLVAVEIVVMAALRDFAPQDQHDKWTPPEDHQRLIGDLGFDSLGVAETVFFLEDLFEVKIGNKDLLKLETVGELRAFVAEKLAKHHS